MTVTKNGTKRPRQRPLKTSQEEPASAVTAATPLAAVLANPEQLKELPIEKVDRMWEIQKEWEDRNAKKAYFEAFSLMQGDLEPVRRSAENEQTHSFYALIDKVQAMLVPILSRHGFSYSGGQRPHEKEGWTNYFITVRHRDGHEENYEMPLPWDDRGMAGKTNKTLVHALGSSQSYGTRYLLINTFGIQLTLDDDGNRASKLAPGSTVISTAAAAEVERRLVGLGKDADRENFLKYFEAESIEEILTTRYDEAVRMLEGKSKYRDDLLNLDSWIDDVGVDKGEFLGRFKVAAVGDLPPSRYVEAMEVVEAAANQLREGGAA